MVEGLDHALCFAFRSDNDGPPVDYKVKYILVVVNWLIRWHTGISSHLLAKINCLFIYSCLSSVPKYHFTHKCEQRKHPWVLTMPAVLLWQVAKWSEVPPLNYNDACFFWILLQKWTNECYFKCSHAFQEVLTAYEIARSQFPNAFVQASTFEDFITLLTPFADKLPVFSQEMGDVWIQGSGSDPRKTAEMRAMFRARTSCFQQGGFEIMYICELQVMGC